MDSFNRHFGPKPAFLGKVGSRSGCRSPARRSAPRTSSKRRHHDDHSTGTFSRSFNPKGLRAPPRNARTPQRQPPPSLGRRLPKHVAPTWRSDSVSNHGLHSSSANPPALSRRRQHNEYSGTITAHRMSEHPKGERGWQFLLDKAVLGRFGSTHALPSHRRNSHLFHHAPRSPLA